VIWRFITNGIGEDEHGPFVALDSFDPLFSFVDFAELAVVTPFRLSMSDVDMADLSPTIVLPAVRALLPISLTC